MENDRTLDSLLDEYLLETKPELWHARPVLSQSQWAVFNGLVSRLEDDNHVVLAGYLKTNSFTANAGGTFRPSQTQIKTPKSKLDL